MKPVFACAVAFVRTIATIVPAVTCISMVLANSSVLEEEWVYGWVPYVVF